MGIVSIVCGALGLVMFALALKFGFTAFALGAALGVVAIVLGVVDRKTGTGKAGLALGLLTVVGGLLLMFLLMSRAAAPEVSPPTAVH